MHAMQPHSAWHAPAWSSRGPSNPPVAVSISQHSLWESTTPRFVTITDPQPQRSAWEPPAPRGHTNPTSFDPARQFSMDPPYGLPDSWQYPTGTQHSQPQHTKQYPPPQSQYLPQTSWDLPSIRWESEETMFQPMEEEWSFDLLRFRNGEADEYAGHHGKKAFVSDSADSDSHETTPDQVIIDSPTQISFGWTSVDTYDSSADPNFEIADGEIGRQVESSREKAGARHLVNELRGVGLSVYGRPEWQTQAYDNALTFRRRSQLSIQELRQRRPIYKLKNELSQAILNNRVMVVIGETGSGKTTQITQYLAAAGYTTEGNIGRTQAAFSIAKRVAEEYGCRVGEEVGYSIRFEECTSAGIVHAKPMERNYIDAAQIDAALIQLTEPEGNILLLLTGHEEIDAVCRCLHKKMKGLDKNVPKLSISFVYSALPSEMQSKRFDSASAGSRKVVVATNMAEMSVTLDGIFYASANQRAGRAGRTGLGKCYCLYIESAFHNEMPPTLIPEIQRINLGIITTLTMHNMGINDLFTFDFMDPPSPQALGYAMRQLYNFGVLAEERLLTKLGRKMAEFPLDPALSKMLLARVGLGCSDELFTIIVMIQTRNIFHRLRELLLDTEKYRIKVLEEQISLLETTCESVAQSQKFLRNFRSKLAENLMLDVLRNVQNPYRGVKFFRWAGRQIEYTRTVAVYHALLELLAGGRDERVNAHGLLVIKNDDAYDILKRILPNLHTYNTLIFGLLMLQRLDEALELCAIFSSLLICMAVIFCFGLTNGKADASDGAKGGKFLKKSKELDRGAEYSLVETLKQGKITKLVAAWVSGTCATLFKSIVQFGYVGAKQFTALQVLYMVDAINEYVVGQLKEYDEEKLGFATTEGFKLDADTEEEKKQIEEKKKSFEILCKVIREILGVSVVGEVMEIMGNNSAASASSDNEELHAATRSGDQTAVCIANPLAVNSRTQTVKQHILRILMQLIRSFSGFLVDSFPNRRSNQPGS